VTIGRRVWEVAGLPRKRGKNVPQERLVKIIGGKEGAAIVASHRGGDKPGGMVGELGGRNMQCKNSQTQ